MKAAAPGDGGERRPLVVMPSAGRRAGFAAWPADARLGTFIITGPDAKPAPHEVPRLRLPDDQGAAEGSAAQAPGQARPAAQRLNPHVATPVAPLMRVRCLRRFSIFFPSG